MADLREAFERGAATRSPAAQPRDDTPRRPTTRSAPPSSADRIASPVDQPDRAQEQGARQEIIIYGRSTLFYWWPVWLSGFIGVSFLAVLLSVVVFTNVKMRGV
ncbi:MAG: hypothetical protein AAGJ70_09540 [Pseudomonadota bacterium]